MSKNKDKKVQAVTDNVVPTRTPADKLLIEFMKLHQIVLVSDSIDVLTPDLPDLVYTSYKKPRLRVFYLDQINEASNQQTTPKSNIEIIE